MRRDDDGLGGSGATTPSGTGGKGCAEAGAMRRDDDGAIAGAGATTTSGKGGGTDDDTIAVEASVGIVCTRECDEI